MHAFPFWDARCSTQLNLENSFGQSFSLGTRQNETTPLSTLPRSESCSERFAVPEPKKFEVQQLFARPSTRNHIRRTRVGFCSDQSCLICVFVSSHPLSFFPPFPSPLISDRKENGAMPHEIMGYTQFQLGLCLLLLVAVWETLLI